MALLEQLSQELEALVARTSPAVVSIAHRRGQGSGLVLAQDGYVLTNGHVVARPVGPIVVGFSDGGEREGRLVGSDEPSDLAVLRVEGSGLPSLRLAERGRVKVGQLVMAIGNPLHFERSVSLGVVSALDRSLAAPGGHLMEGLIQTDAAINPGNSGGPLVAMDGAVAGINTAIVPYAQGIGFAVPASTANWVAAELIRRGQVLRPLLGISARSIELDGERAREQGQARAVRVFGVGPDTPAASAGLREGDLLLSANGSPLGSIDDLQRIMVLAGAPELRLVVLRDRQRVELTLRPAPPQR
ncbi:MAG: trypsin-like peptidase domain-containing protein [Candidatus Lambdaproteobacteria bacterium]|nr:trypsin-like peptidase domain-containing protein [Candidatus Lambdaproteobacteria bacterium]